MAGGRAPLDQSFNQQSFLFFFLFFFFRIVQSSQLLYTGGISSYFAIRTKVIASSPRLFHKVASLDGFPAGSLLLGLPGGSASAIASCGFVGLCV